MAVGPIREALRRNPAGGDALLAAPLVAAAIAQALMASIADDLVTGLAIALLTTVPVAFRRSRPVTAALVSTAAGLIPSDGYVYVGYVAAFIVFYSVAAHVDARGTVVATVVAGCGLAVAGSLIHGAAFGEYFGALSAVAAPAVVGRFVRHQRIQAARLRDLTEQLEREREQRVAEVVGEAADGREAVDLCRRLGPDVVLMDVRLPVMDGIEATRRIAGATPATQTLILTTFDQDENVYRALVAPQILERLVAHFVAAPPVEARRPPELDELTERELEVRRLIGLGLSNDEIAARLYVSMATVKTHVRHVLAKLALRDRVQAVVLAYETGIVRPGSVA